MSAFSASFPMHGFIDGKSHASPMPFRGALFKFEDRAFDVETSQVRVFAGNLSVHVKQPINASAKNFLNVRTFMC